VGEHTTGSSESIIGFDKEPPWPPDQTQRREMRRMVTQIIENFEAQGLDFNEMPAKSRAQWDRIWWSVRP
jgi:hypothetical protein